MLSQEEEAAIHGDAYIDALLSRPRLVALAGGPALEPAVRRAAATLGELPRFHPPFAFEEALAARLRRLSALDQPALAEVIPFPAAAPSLADRRLPALDRRLIVGGALVGGAIASGVSAAAIYAWRQAARRPRSEVVA